MYNPGNRQNIIIIIMSLDSSWRAPRAPTCQNTGNVLNDSVATECAHTGVYTCVCIHVSTWTHFLIHTRSPSVVPQSNKRGPPSGQVLADVLSVLALSLVFWFSKPVLKMTEILRGLGQLPVPCWQIALERTWDGHLMATSLSIKALDRVREL